MNNFKIADKPCRIDYKARSDYSLSPHVKPISRLHARALLLLSTRSSCQDSTRRAAQLSVLNFSRRTIESYLSFNMLIDFVASFRSSNGAKYRNSPRRGPFSLLSDELTRDITFPYIYLTRQLPSTIQFPTIPLTYATWKLEDRYPWGDRAEMGRQKTSRSMKAHESRDGTVFYLQHFTFHGENTGALSKYAQSNIHRMTGKQRTTGNSGKYEEEMILHHIERRQV